jgi:hypothetical protein
VALPIQDLATRSGGCLCGQVRYEARGAPVNVRACHCRLCQRATGQPFYARVLFRAEDLDVTGDYGRYPSSEHLDRGFCRTCGTTLFSIRHAAGLMSVALASLDEPDAFRPEEHIWLCSKLAWVCVEEGVDEYPEAAPA